MDPLHGTTTIDVELINAAFIPKIEFAIVKKVFTIFIRSESGLDVEDAIGNVGVFPSKKCFDSR